ncbi:MAG: MBL fold metallo-hydrolase [Candidatus Micrarchaeota archaeon]|nr:MBL fold metallo-hydrolase [Candidatus Micrarchaeota archaeon]
MLEKIAEETFMLRVDERICGTIYVIESQGKRLAIDSGDGGVELGFVPDLCILTHGHFDHTGGVRKSWKRVLIHPAEFRFKGPYISIPENAEENPMEDVVFGKHRLEFLHTPGHTDGSICVFDRRTGLLFSGDTLFAQGVHGRTDLGGSFEQIQESLGKIRRLPYRLLCPGHGEIERNAEQPG